VDVEPPPRCSDRAYPADLLSAPDAHRDRLVFGMIMDHSSEAHRRREDSVELAATLINGQQGISGRELGVVFCDVQGGTDAPYTDSLLRPDAAVATAEWLVQALEVPGVIGPASSGDTTRVYTEVVKPAAGRTVEITPSGTSPSLTDLDAPGATDESPGLLWRTAPSAERQGQLIAQHMLERTDVKIDRVAIIHEDAAFGVGVAQAFADAWTKRFQLFAYQPDDEAALQARVTDVGDAITEFQALLVLAQVNEMRTFMIAATDNPAYPDDIPIYSGDTGHNAEVFRDIADHRLFDNVLSADAVHPTSFVYNSYSDLFIERYGFDPDRASFTANAYDAMWLMALGAAWATYQGDGPVDEAGRHRVDGLNIARGLRKTTGGSVQVEFINTNWPTGLVQFTAGRAIDAVGAAGNHDWHLDTEEADGPTALFQADADGVFAEIERIE
jgi:branched-chain amino acid transport system substrate-binding protein